MISGSAPWHRRFEKMIKPSRGGRRRRRPHPAAADAASHPARPVDGPDHRARDRLPL